MTHIDTTIRTFYCDICGETSTNGMPICAICGRDVCNDHMTSIYISGYSNGRLVCNDCRNIGEIHIKEIRDVETGYEEAIEAIIQRWKEDCKKEK